jgi:hypothetical protein
MKLIRNILASVAAVFAVASCAIVPEDTFSTAPVAPAMSAHNDILITTATVGEDVTFAWEKARFINTEAYVYDLYVTVGETDALLANDVVNTYYTLSKTDFRTFMKENFELEQNSTHSVSARVEITDAEGKVFASEPISFKVYVYDEAVPSVLSAKVSELVLDKNDPSAKVALLSWNEPRLVYGEDVTYKVTMKVGEGEESVLVEGSYDMAYETTVDALNEAVIAAGGAEDAAVDVNFYVYACCPTIPAGVPSNAVTVKVTTYVATFSEQYYMPGSYQGWDPATAAVLKVSAKSKGLYQGFVDLTTADGSDVEFKFSPVPRWEGDFGFSDVTVSTYGGKYSAATAKTVASDNIKVPSGFYYVKLNKKFNTLDMVQVEYLELIGGFTGDYAGWGKGLKMTYDPASKSWTATEEIEIAKGTEFKVRFNSDWTYSFGTDMNALEFGGGNITFAKNDATYKMILNAATSDLSINAVDVNMPDYLVVAGDYSGHSWNGTDDMRVNLYDSSKGLYRGYITMYDAPYGFKFVKNGSVWTGQTAVDGLTYTLSEGGGENCSIANGSYFWNVDIINMTATATLLTKVGIIGSFAASGWGADVEMTFDAATLTYSVEQTFAAGDEWKFRFNGDWGFNLGQSGDALAHDGANIKVETAGTYVITLDMAHGSVPTYTCVAK